MTMPQGIIETRTSSEPLRNGTWAWRLHAKGLAQDAESEFGLFVSVLERTTPPEPDFCPTPVWTQGLQHTGFTEGRPANTLMPEARADFGEAQPTLVRGFSPAGEGGAGWGLQGLGQHRAGTGRCTRGRGDFGDMFWRRGLLGGCVARAARGRASVCTLLLPSEDPPRGKRSERSPKGAEAARQTASPSATRPGARRFHTRAAALRCAMRERSAMSSSGKADAVASCLPSQCFDPLTRFCVRCSDLFKDNASKGSQGRALAGEGAGGCPGVGLEGTFSRGWWWW